MLDIKLTPKASELICQKQGTIGGKTLWHAKHPGWTYVGAGNSADNAIKDFQHQWRLGTGAYAKIGKTTR